MTDEITVERVQQMITRAPYHQWLGLKVVALHDDGLIDRSGRGLVSVH